MQRCYETGLRCLSRLEITNNTKHFFLCAKATGTTKVSFSACHFILACHGGEFDVVHGAECPPLELRVEIVFAEESCQFEAIYNRKRPYAFISYIK